MSRWFGWHAAALLFIWISTAQAADFPKLDEAIPGSFVATLAPVFDFDGDSCLPSAGISRRGQMNPGLKTSGSRTGECRSSNFMDTSNTLHRHSCTHKNGIEYCGHFYALYFEKDQVRNNSSDIHGHRHDWEYAAIWTKDGMVTHGSRSAHGKLNTRALEELPLDVNGRMKIVYHKDGVWDWSTHALRFAKKNETAENPDGRFVTPTIVSWYSLVGDGVSNAEMRTKLNNYHYGKASIPLKDSRFFEELNLWKPWQDITFRPEQDCTFTPAFSEEKPGGQICPAGYVVSGVECASDYCDKKRLRCCKISELKVSGPAHDSPFFSEEAPNYYKDDSKVVVGMNCQGSYCDKISLTMQNAQGTGGLWTPFFSEETGQGLCNVGSYVAGVRCAGDYCDNLSLYCKSVHGDQSVLPSTIDKIIPPTGFTRIRNRWKRDQYLNIEQGRIHSTAIKPGWHSAMWTIERVQGTDYVRFKNRWKGDQYLNIEQGSIQSTAIKPGWLSAMWTIERVQGTDYVRFKNRWKGDQYLNIEQGRIQSTAIKPGWRSAMWVIEPVR